MADFISEIDKSWSLFLDRDGVINKRIFGGYITNWEEFEFLPGVVEAVSVFSKYFKYIFIVTNQQGIGKGLMSEGDLNSIHDKLQTYFLKNDGRVDAIYFCPELASKEVNCRKPGIWMAEKAKSDFPEIDFKISVMVGDSESDILFGKNAGMKTVLHKSEEKVTVDANLTVDSLLEFAEMLRRLDYDR